MNRSDTGTTPKIQFFYCPGSCSLASQIALEEAGIEYTAVPVNLLGDRGEYWNINPSGKVPALLVGDRLVTENVAILSLCARLSPDAALMPAEPLEEADCLAFLAWCSNTAHIARRQARVPKRFSDDTSIHDSLQRAGRKMFAATLDTIDRRLDPGPWILGETFSICDAYAAVFYDWGLRDEHGMAERSHYTAWIERMQDRASVLRSLEMHQSPLLVRQ